MYIRWDHEASTTPNAQLAFFAEFLATAGVYESWVNRCPLAYSSGNTPHERDVLGTWFLPILAGHHRYAHITGLRGDGVSPQILGMSKIVSEDALRRALARMSANESQNWLRPQLLSSEAITSRALLLAAVGRAIKHAGQTTLYLTTMHASRTALMRLITNI